MSGAPRPFLAALLSAVVPGAGQLYAGRRARGAGMVAATAAPHVAAAYHFDGREALAYARSRWASSDYTRMQRQRCLLSTMAERLDVTKLLRGFPQFASAVKAYVTTDVPLSRLPDLVSLVADVDPGRSVTVTLGPPDYTGAYYSLPSWEPPAAKKPPATSKRKGGKPAKKPEPPPPTYQSPDVGAIRETVRRMILLDPRDLRERYGLLTVRRTC